MIEPKLSTYTIPAPERPAVLYFLGGTVVIGVIALGLAALSAFAVVNNPVEAFFKAVLIEASAIAEAVALARAKRRRDYILPLLGMIVAVWVSGTYNYTQAAQSPGGKRLSPVELYALAIGPLAAVSLLALNFGKALRDFESAGVQWLTDRQTWFDAAMVQYNAWRHAEQLRLEQVARDEAEARRVAETQRLADERERTERALQSQRETEERERQAQLKREDAEAQRQARERERDRKHAERMKELENGSSGGTPVTPTGTIWNPDEAPASPAGKPWESYAEFAEFMTAQNGSAPKTAAEVEKMGLPHSTAYRYWDKWQSRKTAEVVHTN
jgi:hypothetical protein